MEMEMEKEKEKEKHNNLRKINTNKKLLGTKIWHFSHDDLNYNRKIHTDQARRDCNRCFNFLVGSLPSAEKSWCLAAPTKGLTQQQRTTSI